MSVIKYSITLKSSELGMGWVGRGYLAIASAVQWDLRVLATGFHVGDAAPWSASTTGAVRVIPCLKATAKAVLSFKVV